MSRQIMYQKEWLRDLKIINTPMSAVKLEVMQTVTEKNRQPATTAGGNDKYIVTLKAVAKDRLDRLKTVFAGKTEVPIEETRDIFLTGSIWVKPGEEAKRLPLRNEVVVCNVALVPNADKTDRVLRVTDIVMQATGEAQAINLDTFFDDLPTAEEMEAAKNEEDLRHSEITH